MNRLGKYSALAVIATAIGAGAVNASGWYENEDCPRSGPRYGQWDDDDGSRGRFGMQRHGMRGPGMFRPGNLDLSADELRTVMQARLIMHGNDNLKIGEIAAKDENTYSVQLITNDGSLVRELEVDKNTGPRRMGPRPF